MSKTFPARRLVAVTPSDSTVYSPPLRAVIVGTQGNLSIIAADDTDPVTVFVAAGVPIAIECKVIRSTGTTATGVVGLR